MKPKLSVEKITCDFLSYVLVTKNKTVRTIYIVIGAHGFNYIFSIKTSFRISLCCKLHRSG